MHTVRRNLRESAELAVYRLSGNKMRDPRQAFELARRHMDAASLLAAAEVITKSDLGEELHWYSRFLTDLENYLVHEETTRERVVRERQDRRMMYGNLLYDIIGIRTSFTFLMRGHILA